MVRPSRLSLVLLLALAVPVAASPGAWAQSQSPGWFVPNQQAPRSAAPRAAVPPNVGPRAAPLPPIDAAPLEQQADVPPPPPIDVPLPPMPEIPPVPKGTAPPAVVVGVLSVPDVMHASTAAQQVEKIINERREKLNEDANKEQQIWRDMQQSLANQRSALTQEALNTRARELQERITNAQRSFRDRNNIIQNAAQYSLNQIERVLVQIIKEVAQSRGMNLVLHRSQVALNVNELDITDQVAQQLNKTLPSVEIPGDGVSLADLAKKSPPATTPASVKSAAPAQAAPSKK